MLKGFGVLFAFWFLETFWTEYLTFFYPLWSCVLESYLVYFFSENSAFPVMIGLWQLGFSEDYKSWVRVANKCERLLQTFKTPCWSCSQDRETNHAQTPHRTSWWQTLHSVQSGLQWLCQSPTGNVLDSGSSLHISTFPHWRSSR